MRSALILAGGRSTHFGEADKAVVDVDAADGDGPFTNVTTRADIATVSGGIGR